MKTRFLKWAGQLGLLFLSATAATPTMAQNYERTALDQNWRLRASEFPEASDIPTKVPGMVQEELIRSGLLPDPYYGTNEDQAQWVGEKDWEYLLDWEVPTLDSNRTYQLDFRGLDTYAQVYLNDSLILTADNMFRSWQVPVTALLREGTNQLRVAFTAPLSALRGEIEAFPYPLNKTSVNDTGNPPLANFARKAQFQFGWDWGLRLVTMGIWRPVYLESWVLARIEDVQYYTESITPEVAKVRVAVQLERTTPGAYELRIRGVENGQFYAKRPLAADEEVVNFNFTIDRPRRWWPNGHGEAYRYHLVCELWRDGELIATHERKIGLRTVELVQQDDAYGTSFFFKINGRPIFTKGASYIPQDAVLTRITPEQKTTLLQQCQAAHLNLVRVWGGGVYEDEHFYDQCDSLGLMVWQDFMFACAAYPSFPAFADNVAAEVRENIRRLRNHPSIIKWCGNNEVFLAMKNWGWQLKYGIHGKNNDAMFQSYDDLFQTLIPGILAEEDPDRPYSHTTPTSSWHKASEIGRGSLHYWGVWHGPDDFSGYETKVGRYMNEYGFQSFPDMETIARFADSSQWSLESPVMAHHQKSYIGNGLIGKFTKKYGQPANDFPEFVYQSQMVQYEGIRRAILAHRLRWGYCMGTTFWQLNDCWPAPSWSAIDYYGRPKVLFQELGNLYASIVAAAVGDARAPELAIISDRPSAAEVMLRWERIDTRNGTRLSSGEKKVVVLQPGTVLVEPPLGMVPAKTEFTTIRLEVQGELISIFRWSGQQEPLRLPQEAGWQRFPELVR
jgi:beta-mannosidase